MPALTDGKLTRSRRSLRLRILVALLLVFVLGSCLSAVHTYGTRDDLRRSILLLQARTLELLLMNEEEAAALSRKDDSSPASLAAPSLLKLVDALLALE